MFYCSCLCIFDAAARMCFIFNSCHIHNSLIGVDGCEYINKLHAAITATLANTLKVHILLHACQNKYISHTLAMMLVSYVSTKSKNFSYLSLYELVSMHKAQVWS